MKALKCDICGKYYDYNPNEITRIAFCPPFDSPVSEKDICPECLAAVATTLEDRKKIKIQKKTDPFENDGKRFAQNKHVSL